MHLQVSRIFRERLSQDNKEKKLKKCCTVVRKMIYTSIYENTTPRKYELFLLHQGVCFHIDANEKYRAEDKSIKKKVEAKNAWRITSIICRIL